MKQIKIVLVEDNVFDVELIERELKRAAMSYQLKITETRKGFIKELKNFKPDIVLSDHSLPDFDSMEALQILKDNFLDIPFILVTGAVSEEFAIASIKAGADDYILKSSLRRLPSAIDNIFSRREIKLEKESIEALHTKLKIAYSEIEEKNKSMADSISYANLIQKSMFPNAKALKKIFPESFIIHKPKDIVSGDFYWFTETSDKFIIAVADCTGHGVPGALMSMLGYSLLGEIVNSQKITKPSEILKQLNLKILQTLKQDVAENHAHDGMEIGLCSIDRKRGKMEFAGGGRPLFYFHQGELKKIKGHKYGVGGVQTEIREYTNHELPIAATDIFYLFSDGYADQFGGAKEKKMMMQNFSKLLQVSQRFDMHEQERTFAQWLKKWQRDFEQTDDILLIGIRL